MELWLAAQFARLVPYFATHQISRSPLAYFQIGVAIAALALITCSYRFQAKPGIWNTMAAALLCLAALILALPQ